MQAKTVHPSAALYGKARPLVAPALVYLSSMVRTQPPGSVGARRREAPTIPINALKTVPGDQVSAWCAELIHVGLK
jgi:hypothetical protein